MKKSTLGEDCDFLVQFFGQFVADRLWHLPRRAFARGQAALLEWLNPQTNFFLLRALRIEARQNKPLLTLATLLVLTGVIFFGIFKLYGLVQTLPESGRNSEFRSFIESLFTANFINWIALAVAAISGYGVLWASRARSAFLLRQELLKKTLVQLQQLPLHEERWLWMMAAHPMLLGALIGFCGLPVYALAVFTGQWNALDVLSLLLLFCALSHAAPNWQPAQWQQNDSKNRAQGNWKRWRQALAQNASDAKRKSDLSPAQKMEAGRHAARILHGYDAHGELTTEDNTPTKANTSTLFGKAKKRNGWSVFGYIWIGIVITNSLRSLPVGGLWSSLTAHWPREVLSLLPALPLTWPVVIAKLLISPLPFFGLALPPVFVLLPLWLALGQRKFLSLSALVSAAETFWTPRRAARMQSLQTIALVLAATFILGYGWPILIEAGELGRILVGATASRGNALAALWTLLLVGGVLLCGLQVEKLFKSAGSNFSEKQQAWRGAIRLAWLFPLGAIALYFVFCWLGLLWGTSALWLARLPLTLCTAAAFVLADSGGAALAVTLSPAARWTWNRLRALWFHWLALAVIPYALLAYFQGRMFSFNDAPLVVFSPFVSLFALFRSAAPTAMGMQPLLWLSLGVQALIGALCWLRASRYFLGQDELAAEYSVAQGSEASPFRRLLAPLFAFEKMIFDFLGAFFAALGEWWQSVRGLNQAVVAWAQKWDNAVLTYELRRRASKENWALWILITFLFELSLFLILAQPWNLWKAAPSVFKDWGVAVVTVSLVVMWVLGILCASPIGRSFDADRANGTLVFLFLTPQTDREILLGKLLSHGILGAFILSTGVLYALLGMVLGAAFGGHAILALLAASGLIAALSVAAFAAAANLFFAIRATKPTAGQSWSLLFCLGVEISLIVIGTYAFSRFEIRLDRVSELTMSVLLLAAALLHLVLARLFWTLAMRIFKQRRYGDVDAAGKSAG